MKFLGSKFHSTLTIVQTCETLMVIIIPLYALMGNLSISIKMEKLYFLSMLTTLVAFIFTTVFLVDYP